MAHFSANYIELLSQTSINNVPTNTNNIMPTILSQSHQKSSRINQSNLIYSGLSLAPESALYGSRPHATSDPLLKQGATPLTKKPQVRIANSSTTQRATPLGKLKPSTCEPLTGEAAVLDYVDPRAHPVVAAETITMRRKRHANHTLAMIAPKTSKGRTWTGIPKRYGAVPYGTFDGSNTDSPHNMNLPCDVEKTLPMYTYVPRMTFDGFHFELAVTSHHSRHMDLSNVSGLTQILSIPSAVPSMTSSFQPTSKSSVMTVHPDYTTDPLLLSNNEYVAIKKGTPLF